MKSHQVKPGGAGDVPRGSEALDVLQIITTIDVGGAETHLLSLCRGLVGAGHRVDVIYLKGRGALEPELARLGVRAEKVELESAAQFASCVYGLYRRIRARRYAVVHTHLLKANFAGALASRLAGNPHLVASKHNDEPQLLNPVVSRLHRHASKLDRRILCASQHILEHTVRHGGVERAKCQTLYYGVEDPQAADGTPRIRAELNLDESAPLIACVARLVPRKGHAHLLEALVKVVARRGDVRLLIVGDGESRADLESRAGALGLTSHTLFLGTRRDVPEILRAADLLVLPSEAEGLGRVILEAMAAGKPVVASRVGGIPEIVAHGDTGYLVQPGDPGELADRIIGILADREAAAVLGHAGRRRMEQQFSMQAMMQQILAVYREAGAGD